MIYLHVDHAGKLRDPFTVKMQLSLLSWDSISDCAILTGGDDAALEMAATKAAKNCQTKLRKSLGCQRQKKNLFC